MTTGAATWPRMAVLGCSAPPRGCGVPWGAQAALPPPPGARGGSPSFLLGVIFVWGGGICYGVQLRVGCEPSAFLWEGSKELGLGGGTQPGGGNTDGGGGHSWGGGHSLEGGNTAGGGGEHSLRRGTQPGGVVSTAWGAEHSWGAQTLPHRAADPSLPPVWHRETPPHPPRLPYSPPLPPHRRDGRREILYFCPIERQDVGQDVGQPLTALRAAEPVPDVRTSSRGAAAHNEGEWRRQAQPSSPLGSTEGGSGPPGPPGGLRTPRGGSPASPGPTGPACP